MDTHLGRIIIFLRIIEEKMKKVSYPTQLLNNLNDKSSTNAPQLRDAKDHCHLNFAPRFNYQTIL